MKKLIIKGLRAVTGRGLIVLGGFLVSSFAAQLLPKEQAGWFFLLFNIATFASLVGRFGLETTALRLLSEDVADKNYYRLSESFNKIKLLLLIQSSLVAGLIAVVLSLMPYDISTSSILWVAAYALLLSFQFFYSEALRSLSMLIASGLFGGALVNLTTAFVTFWWVGNTDDFTIFFKVLVGLSILNIAVCEWYSRAVIKKREVQPSINNRAPLSTKEIYRISSPLGVRSVLAFVLTNSDLWIISLFLEPSSVAVYGAVSRFAFLINFGLQLVNVLVAPKVARINFKGNLQHLEKVVRQSTTLATLPTLFLFTALVVFGEAILGFVFGDSYASGYQVMVIILAGRCFNAMSGPCGYTLMMTGHQNFVRKSIFWVTLSTVTVAVGLSFIWPSLTLIALIYALGAVAQVFSLMFKVKREFGFYTFAHPKYLRWKA